MVSEYRLAYMKQWRKENQDKVKLYQKKGLLKLRYGLSLNAYNNIRKSQNYCCALCGRHEREFTRSMHVDHDHHTKEVRGILCVHCNNKLGWYENWKEKVENYLRGN